MLRYCTLSNKKLNLWTVSEWACAYCAKSGDGDARGHWGGGENLYAMTKMMVMVAGEGCKETFRRNGDRDKQPVGPRLSIEVTITRIILSQVFVFRSVYLSVCLCVSVCEAFIIILSPSLSSWLIKSISPTSGKFKDFCKTHLSGLVSTRSRAPLAAETSLLSSLQGTESQRLRSVFSFYLWWLVIKSHPKSLSREICLSWNKILPRLQ